MEKSKIALNRKYTLKPSANIDKHNTYTLTQTAPIQQLPPSFSLAEKFPMCYNQEDIGSCTANAGAGCFQYLSGDLSFTPSRLFIYYNERMVDGDVDQDDGSSIQTCVNVLEKFGVCPESLWTYSHDHLFVQPPPELYTIAKNYIITKAEVIQGNNLDQIKHSIVSGYPVIIGMTVYESFESQEVEITGILPMPQPNEQILGGHAVDIVGYDDASKMFIVRNSWGTQWGFSGGIFQSRGYFKMPYDFAANPNYVSEIWSIQTKN